MHMTIGLFEEPMRGPNKRIKEPGDGVPVKVLKKKDVASGKWVKIHTLDDQTVTGWLSLAYLK